MFVRRVSILSITIFAFAIVLGTMAFHANTPSYAEPLFDPIITGTVK